MSLRVKWTILLAALVAGTIAIAGFAANAFIRDELTNETDEFLLARADAVDRLVRDSGGRRFLSPRRPPTRSLGGQFGQFDAITQAVDINGEVLVTEGQVVLPVDTVDRAVAAGDSGRVLRTVEVDEIRYRMITASLVDNVAVQIARDESETVAVLDGFRRRLWLAGLLGAGVAGLVGWFGAGRAIRPVRRVTAAAEDVARTQDLSEPLPVEGDDELARLAASFNTMTAALRQSKEQQHRLVMDASHELRTPLTSLRTSIEVLEHGIPDGDARDRLLANASSELRELTTLVNELVDLAVDQSPGSGPRVDTSLASVADQAADRGRQRHHRTIEVRVDHAATVQASPEALDRAVNNLIDNAAKFSPDDTPIDVTVSGTTIEVRDHGPGIDAADLDLVFERFYRADMARTLPGSGLGLAIVSQVATDHGGAAFARNHPDGGAVVGFTVASDATL